MSCRQIAYLFVALLATSSVRVLAKRVDLSNVDASSESLVEDDFKCCQVAEGNMIGDVGYPSPIIMNIDGLKCRQSLGFSMGSHKHTCKAKSYGPFKTGSGVEVKSWHSEHGREGVNVYIAEMQTLDKQECDNVDLFCKDLRSYSPNLEAYVNELERVASESELEIEKFPDAESDGFQGLFDRFEAAFNTIKKGAPDKMPLQGRDRNDRDVADGGGYSYAGGSGFPQGAGVIQPRLQPGLTVGF